jgi:hypothetical protein
MNAEPKCKICWDKGYSTELIGNTVAHADFCGDKTKIIKPSHIRKNYCKCAKGKKMKAREEGVGVWRDIDT